MWPLFRPLLRPDYTLSKLRNYIYIFRNRRSWSKALEQQAQAMDLLLRYLTLDMPIQWNSTYEMISLAC